MESEWGGFRLLPWDSTLREDTRLVARYTVQVPEEVQRSSLQSLTSYLGTGYAYKSLLPIAAKILKRTMSRPFISPARLICSESVVLFINKCGAGNMQEPHKWSPEDVLSYIRSKPDMFNKEL